jgi:dTDP-4-amino-4,6-dideoxygalactose transaminase
MKIPQLDLKPMFLQQEAELRAAIDRVLDSQHFIMGPEVDAFEREMHAWLGASTHAISCSSGSAALLLAMMALDLGPGDEVILPAYTFFATAGCVARLGATPVWIDIEPSTSNLDPSLLADKLTDRTRAVIPVHLYGRPADLDAIDAALQAAGRADQVTVVEDAAQALSARYKGQRVPTLAPIGAISFFPSKNLGAFGDAGMITCRDPEVADRLRVLRTHGAKKKYHNDYVGVNSRLDALQAAVLRVRLKALDGWTASRRAIAERYRALLAEAGLDAFVAPPPPDDATFSHAYNQFSLSVERRDELKAFLASKGVETAVYYPEPLHLQPCFAHLGAKPGSLPVTERACTRALALPITPTLTEAEQAYVVAQLAAFYLGA